MPAHVAKRLIQMLIQQGKSPQDCKVLMMGMTFKEDVSDIRNSKVADLVKEIKAYSVKVDIIDPHASHEEVAHEYGVAMIDKPSNNYDAVVVSVAHADYKSLDMDYFKSIMNDNPILFDLKAVYPKEVEGMKVWRL
jgi:UDP-N-acetyl-D-galactosamine dehydrogenase